jgi:hypothetical protein
MPNGVKIDEEIFEGLGHSEQNTILFKNTERILKTLVSTKEECDQRMGCIEANARRQKWFNKGVSFIGGIIGGVLAVISGIGK